MDVGTGAAGVAAATPIFFCWSLKSVYKKNENEKKDVKFVFSCNVFFFFVKFTGVIFAKRDNCPQGVKD